MMHTHSRTRGYCKMVLKIRHHLKFLPQISGVLSEEISIPIVNWGNWLGIARNLDPNSPELGPQSVGTVFLDRSHESDIAPRS